VLQQVDKDHYANHGITRDAIDDASQELFPDADPFTTVRARSRPSGDDTDNPSPDSQPSPSEIAEDRGPAEPPGPDRGPVLDRG
jgi:hypothetical protein